MLPLDQEVGTFAILDSSKLLEITDGVAVGPSQVRRSAGQDAVCSREPSPISIAAASPSCFPVQSLLQSSRFTAT